MIKSGAINIVDCYDEMLWGAGELDEAFENEMFSKIGKLRNWGALAVE